MPTEAQKRANQKWNAANMVTMSCRLKKEIADDFKTACIAAGTTPYEVLKKAVYEYIGKEEA